MTEDSSKNFLRAKKKYEQKNRRQRRRESRKLIRKNIKKSLMLCVGYFNQGLITAVSFCFQKEILLATTIWISSYMSYCQSRQLSATLTEQQIQLGKIETHLAIQTNNQQGGKSLVSRINWLALGTAFYAVTLKIQTGFQRRGLVKELMLSYDNSNKATESINQMHDALTHQSINLEHHRKINKDLEIQVNKKNIEIKKIQDEVINLKKALTKKFAEINYQGHLLKHNELQIKKYQNEKTELKLQIDQIIKKLNLDKTMQSVSEFTKAGLEQKLLIVKNELDKLNHNNIELTSVIKSENDFHQQLNKVNEIKKLKIDILNDKIDQNKSTTDELNNQINKLNSKIYNLKTQENFSNQECSNLKNTIKKNESDIVKLNNDNKYLLKIISDFQNENQKIIDSSFIMENQLKTSKNNLKKNSKIQDEKTTKINQLNQEINKLNRCIQQLENKVDLDYQTKVKLEDQLLLKTEHSNKLQFDLGKSNLKLKQNEMQISVLKTKLKEGKLHYNQLESQNRLLQKKIDFLELELKNKEKVLDEAYSNLEIQRSFNNKWNSNSAKSTSIKVDKNKKHNQKNNDIIFTGTLPGMDGTIVPLINN